MQLRQRTQTRKIFFSLTLSNRVFKEYSEHFKGVSNVFRIPKSFKAFQKSFQRVSKRFKRVSKRFKRVSKGFQSVSRVSKRFKRVSKGFQSISKGFPKGFRRVSKRFQRVSKGFQSVSKGFQSVSKGFPKGFKAFPKGFQRVSNPLKPGFQRVSEWPQTPWKTLLWKRSVFVWRVTIFYLFLFYLNVFSPLSYLLIWRILISMVHPSSTLFNPQPQKTWNGWSTFKVNNHLRLNSMKSINCNQQGLLMVHSITQCGEDQSNDLGYIELLHLYMFLNWFVICISSTQSKIWLGCYKFDHLELITLTD